jgi:hypothetical protein
MVKRRRRSFGAFGRDSIDILGLKPEAIMTRLLRSQLHARILVLLIDGVWWCWGRPRIKDGTVTVKTLLHRSFRFLFHQ